MPRFHAASTTPARSSLHSKPRTRSGNPVPLRTTMLANFALIACLLAAVPMARINAQVAPAPAVLPSVPTTHVLAIGHVTDKWTASLRAGVMAQEVRETVKLYLGGKISEWFVRQDQPGVVFLMNANTVKEAKELLDALPLGVAHAMDFDLIPVGPLSPLSLLLAPAASKPSEKN